MEISCTLQRKPKNKQQSYRLCSSVYHNQSCVKQTVLHNVTVHNCLDTPTIQHCSCPLLPTHVHCNTVRGIYVLQWHSTCTAHISTVVVSLLIFMLLTQETPYKCINIRIRRKWKGKSSIIISGEFLYKFPKLHVTHVAIIKAQLCTMYISAECPSP